jgi:hypothetical protein
MGYTTVLSPTTLNSLHITFNKTLNDRPLPPAFTDPGAKVFSLRRAYGQLRCRERLFGYAVAPTPDSSI